jgi:superfamily II DNA or RNA helicase
VPLRPYQNESLAAIKAAYENGVSRQLVVLPTGSGKTILFARLPETLDMKPGEQMLVIVHREELCTQSLDKIQHANPSLRVEIEKAEKRAAPDADIVIASVQSIGRAKETSKGQWEYGPRLRKFNERSFRYVVVDECHHGTASTYQNVLRYFRCLKGMPNIDNTKLLLGVTATPRRGDCIGLEAIFDRIVFSRNTRDLIEQGWLADCKAFRIWTKHDISGVHTKKGDFDTGELEDTINTPLRNKLIVDKYLELGEGMTAVAFTNSIQHSEDLAAMFTRSGVNAHALSGNTPDKERRDLISSHASGDVQVLASCGVLCLDTQTEILTKDGWKSNSSLLPSDEVANWSNGNVFFERPIRIVSRERSREERMVNMRSEYVDLRVTEDHAILHHCRNSGVLHRSPARGLVGRRFMIPVSGDSPADRISIPQEKRPPIRRQVIKTSHELRKRHGMSWEESKREAERRALVRHSLVFKHPQELSLDECSLIGFWMGDGWTTPLKSGGVEYVLSESTKTPLSISFVDGLLNKCGISCLRKIVPPSLSMPPRVHWHISRGTGGGDQKRDGIYHLEPYLIKGKNPHLWGLSKDQLWSMLVGFWYADGDHGDCAKVPKCLRIANTNLALLEWLQVIACCRGFRARISHSANDRGRPNASILHRLTIEPMFSTHIGARANSRAAGNTPIFESGWKPETVWCVTSASGNIIVRRNGKVSVVGNSEGWDNPMCSVAIMARPTKSSLLFCQQLGRVLRPWPAPESQDSHFGWVKPYAIVLDFADQTGRHEPMSIASLFGLRATFNPKGKSIVKTVQKIEEIERGNPMLELRSCEDLEEVQAVVEQVQLFRAPAISNEAKHYSRFTWVQETDDTVRLSTPGLVLYIQTDQLGQRQLWESREGFRKLVGSWGDPAGAYDYADQLVPQENRGLVLSTARWRSEPPTEKQARMLYFKDKKLRGQFSSPDDLYRFIKNRHDAGDKSFSKGSCSSRIDALMS